MPEIKQLPPSVINKIAAGEVIERPASVVKELLENAVDSGPTRIDVSIEKGGSDLVRVSDNGCGIAESQLTLAVASHATSKIRDADDLFNVATLGFRGEALASIAEISQFTLRSRPANTEAGAELEVIGGRLSEVTPCGCPVGTCVEVRNVFYNTPVRRKFLRTTQTEMGHASEAFTRIALAHPEIHFTLRHNERTLFDLLPVQSWRERIGTFFGDDVAAGLIPVSSTNEHARLSGYAADPHFNRGNNRMQYLFLNGRHIRDRALQHALSEAYRGLLLTGRYPIAFLRLDIAPEAVDVNVHPTKLEVRFQDAGQIYSQLLGTLRQKFLSTDLTAKIQSSPENGAEAAGATNDSVAHVTPDRSALIPTAHHAPASEPANQGGLDLRYDRSTTGLPEFQPFNYDSTVRHSPESANETHLPNDTSATPVSMPLDDRSFPAQPAPSPTISDSGIQLHNRYLITDTENGIVVIDQHALHERVLYEQLREKVLAGSMEVQRLLVPEPVSLPPAEAAAVLDARKALAKLGIEIEPFGGDTVLISTYPAMLANLGPADLLRQVVDQLMDGGKSPDRRDLVDELLHMISCKAAIKAGDRLASEEVHALLEQRHLFQDTHHCPHGRPTALVFTNEELDKRFKRI